MAEHALLSPSGASRWLKCPPSVRLSERLEDTESEAAREGTLAHAISELLIGRKLGRVREKEYKTKLAAFMKHELFEKSMLEYCEEYAAFVLEQYHEAQQRSRDAQIYLETKWDMSRYAPEAFGTGDVGIGADEEAVFIDLKYGKGVPVSAIDNDQCKMYALGMLEELGLLFNIKRIKVIIYQPRLDNISTWVISVTDLLSWANSVLKPAAALAFEGQGEYKPGDHCLFCRAKTTCKANAEYQMVLAKYEFMNAALLEPQDIADILNRYDSFKNWMEAVWDYALAESIKGKQWPGYKVVEGKSNRKYTDEKKVRAMLKKLGYVETDFTTTALNGLTAIEKLLGKTDFNKYIDKYLEKPTGKPTLVPESDPRPVYDRNKDAADDFK